MMLLTFRQVRGRRATMHDEPSGRWSGVRVVGWGKLGLVVALPGCSA